MYNVLLTKIESTHKNLRTDEVYGVCEKLPKKGEGFRMYSQGLWIKDGVRLVTTSPVGTVLRDGDVMHFKTENSTYRLEIFYEASDV